MSKFSFDETQLKVLSNFAGINQQLLVEPDCLSVMSVSKFVLAKYSFGTPFNFESFGLYNTNDFLAVMSAMKKAQIEVKDKCLVITSDSDKLTYYTTAKELVPKVPDVDTVFKDLTYDLEFSLPADRLTIITKMASMLKAEYMFFETLDINGKSTIRITVGNELESSNNSYEIFIDTDIKINQLEEAVKISIEEFKVLAGEYNVGIAKKFVKGKNKYFSRWSNLNGVNYFIATEAV